MNLEGRWATAAVDHVRVHSWRKSEAGVGTGKTQPSQFLLKHADGMVRVWHQQRECMDPTCLVSTVQAAAGGLRVKGKVFLAHFSPLIPINHGDTACLRIAADHVHHFMVTDSHYIMATSCKIMPHPTKQKSQAGFGDIQ